MFWKRAKPQQPPPDRPTDDQAMALLRDKLEELAPGFAKGSAVKNGMLFGRHRGWAVMSLPNHTDHPGHFDLGFITNLGTPDDDPAAIPGWHAISSGVLSYGPDEASNEALQAAVLDSQILRVLATELRSAMDRPQLNGIKVFLCRTRDSTTAEIRVNGESAVLASEVMAAYPWPDVVAPTMARFYAVAMHPS